ncbi:FAD-dependent monooxygenase [Nocardia goodfellowii]
MVTIIGGGIAGTVLAGALARRDYSVTVFERQPSVRGGAFLVLDRHAHDALADLGVSLGDLHAASYPVPGLQFHYRPDTRNAVGSGGQRLYRRSELMRVLTEFATAARADIRYDVAVTELDPVTGTLYSDDRVVAVDDLIIAADGIDSIARGRLEPERVPRYAGQVVLYGTTRGRVFLHTDPTILHFDGQLGAGPIPLSTFGHHWNDDAAFWFVRLTRDPILQQDNGFHPTADWAEAVRQAAPNLPEAMDTLLAATDRVHVSNARIVPLTGAAPPAAPVILCGDADHAITPAAARGAIEAIDDAAALFEAVLAGGDPAAAMADRRARITVEREQSQRRFASPRP